MVGIGIAALDAAVTYDAAKAKGVDGVLCSFAQSPFGPWLLIIVVLGLIVFGILSFVEAKWRCTIGESPSEDGVQPAARSCAVCGLSIVPSGRRL